MGIGALFARNEFRRIFILAVDDPKGLFMRLDPAFLSFLSFPFSSSRKKLLGAKSARFFLLTALLFQGVHLQSQWNEQLGPSSHLKAIAPVDSSIAWAVGYDGEVQRTINGGDTWFFQFSGTSEYLYSVDFVDVSYGWAVGDNGTIQYTSDGGDDWNAQSSGSSEELRSVDFVDTSSGWAVGRSGTILHTTDGGSNWNPQSSGTMDSLYDVQFINTDTGWACGSDGTMLHTMDGGSTWNSQPTGVSVHLRSLHFIDADSGWAVGPEDMIIHTSDGGNTWNTQHSGSALIGLRSVFFLDPSHGWAVGQGGTVYYTTDGGDDWEARSTGTTDLLGDVHFFDPSHGWAVGGTVENDGVILHTDKNLSIPSEVKEEKGKLSISPNPAREHPRVEFEAEKGQELMFSLHDAMGRRVLGRKVEAERGLNSSRFDVSGLEAGVYLLRAETIEGDLKWNEKLVVR